MMLENSIHNLETGKSLKIVALGDSLTYGWMVQKGYLDYLQEMLTAKYPGADFEIINRGVPGDTAGGGFRRLDDHVLCMDPDLVFVQFALNDAFSGCPADEFQRNIAAIVGKIRAESSSEILLMTSVALSDACEDNVAETYYERIECVAEDEGVPVALVHKYWKMKLSEGVKFSELLQSDNVHPTSGGYCLMAEAVAEMFYG